MTTQCRVIVPDCHVPFHDQPLIDVMLEQIRELRPDGVDVLGDIIDAYPVSRFDKNPARKQTLRDELEGAKDLLADIRKAARPTRKTKVVDLRFTEGNHESRITRMLWGPARAFHGLKGLSVPELLEVEKHGFVFHGPDEPYKVGPLTVTHGDVAKKSNWSSVQGGTVAGTVARRVGSSVLVGHTHMMGHVTINSWNHRWDGYECGCLCRMDMEYIIGIPQWTQGWAVAWIGEHAYNVEFVRSVPCGDYRKIVWRDRVLAELPGLTSKPC